MLRKVVIQIDNEKLVKVGIQNDTRLRLKRINYLRFSVTNLSKKVYESLLFRSKEGFYFLAVTRGSLGKDKKDFYQVTKSDPYKLTKVDVLQEIIPLKYPQ